MPGEHKAEMMLQCWFSFCCCTSDGPETIETLEWTCQRHSDARGRYVACTDIRHFKRYFCKHNSHAIVSLQNSPETTLLIYMTIAESMEAYQKQEKHDSKRAPN